jgi:hypothetical protein
VCKSTLELKKFGVRKSIVETESRPPLISNPIKGAIGEKKPSFGKAYNDEKFID